MSHTFNDPNKIPKHRVIIEGQQFMYTDGSYHVQVSVLRGGAAFGELALLSADCLR
jgi:hypothetical protein